MLAYTYIKHGTFQMMEKPVPEIKDPRDAVVRVTLGSICTSDLHIKHGSVPRAVPGITVGHEMVGIVERVGENVTSVKPGDRVTVNVETFCGECFFCRHGYVNNCEDEQGGWALGCRIDGGRRPCDGQRGDLLWRMLFLSSWICKQLRRRAGRLGIGMPHRRRTGRICACPLC